jgi:7-carboxy-7-deazaguanine synthase
MRVCEIFAGIQGESTYAGLPCVFVRLTGCNLRCAYCDTTYAYEEGAEMTGDEVIDHVRGYGLRLVEITGGEPLLQADAKPLAGRLLDLGYKVLIETNGSVDIGGMDCRAVVVMDVKTPGSGVSDSVRKENFGLLKKTDELKFVITDRADYEWAVDMIGRYGLTGKCVVLFSPAFGTLPAEEVCKWTIEDRLDARINLQLHKYIYGPYRRGV